MCYACGPSVLTRGMHLGVLRSAIMPHHTWRAGPLGSPAPYAVCVLEIAARAPRAAPSMPMHAMGGAADRTATRHGGIQEFT